SKMRLQYFPPKKYNFNLPIFDGGGEVTERVLNGLENVMAAYVDIANLSKSYLHQNPQNYRVEEVRIVGSSARENRIDSDLDFLLVASRLDELSANQAKMFLAMIYFCDLPKKEAIDVFIRPKEIYPNRSSIIISDQKKVKKII